MSDEANDRITICIGGGCDEGDGAGIDGSGNDSASGQRDDDAGQLTGTARHAGNADAQWRAVTSTPDFCRVGDKIVGFDSSATLDTPVRRSPDVILAGQPAYRVGDLCRGIQGDAGSGIVSGTSGGSGHVRFLDGQRNVKINGQPLVRDGNPCLINCNAAGTGGAQGYVQTTTRGAQSQPAGGGTPSVAERFQQQAGDVSQQADDLRQQLNVNPNGKTHAEALALQERVNQLNAETQQLRQALYDAAREGELRDDALNDALFDVEEATHRANDLRPEADRQVRYTSSAGQTARAIGEFGAETLTPYGTAVDIKDTWELFATGQYGAAIGMTLLTAAGLIPGVRAVDRTAEGIDEIHDLAKGADAAEEAAGRGVHVSSTSDSVGNKSSKSAGKRESSRSQYMGKTPDKYSRTGREVVERMRQEGLIEGEGPLLRGNPNNLRLSNSDGTFSRIDHKIDMAHKTDAVTWWNEQGRFFGPKSPEVRKFMLDSDNYILQDRAINRSEGAGLGQRYKPPMKPDFSTLKR